MKSLLLICTGISIGVVATILFNQPQSQFASARNDFDDAADKTSAWGTEQRVKGTGGNLLGKAKTGVGKATGDDKLAGEGLVDQAAGAVKDTAGKAAHAVSDTIDNLKK